MVDGIEVGRGVNAQPKFRLLLTVTNLNISLVDVV